MNRSNPTVIKTIYVTDLDGTLLQPDATLSDNSLRILSQLLEDGLPLTVATARTSYSVLPILRGLPVSLPLILQNGAVLYDAQAKRILHAACIQPDAFREVCGYVEKSGVNGFAYCIEDGVLRCCYTELTTAHMRQFYQERRDRYDKPFLQVKSLAQLADLHPVYLSICAPQPLLDPLVQNLQTVPDIALSYYRDIYCTDIWYLEVSAPDATKYHGVQKLKELTGAEKTVGFGDNHNDLPLFDACDYKVAVGNAAAELKTQADCVIGTNTEDAVAAYLQSLFASESTE